MEGTGDGTPMWREDHNCMWDLNAIPFNADGRNTVEKFENETNSTVLAQWGHVQDHAVAGIVEFHPVARSRAESAQGTVIANGLAACELAPRFGGNSYTANVERLTANILSYLELKDSRGSITAISSPESDKDSPAEPEFIARNGGVEYDGVTPGTAIYIYSPDGRLLTRSTAVYPSGVISVPRRGAVIVRCGQHAAKLLIK